MKKTVKKQIANFRQFEIKTTSKKAVKGGNSTPPVPNPDNPDEFIGIEDIFAT